ncbi:Chemotaxis protein CheD [Nitrincola lacisaponensis]|uniref:Probable chemoreceptor glutamine deamidase CheD n=1 Tax=Nitrincola lacisaponensis TaxID=267850 RepID=A0A063XY90_9GAMM|nr:chemoreceptor glutamine deamidase CheD [Nitrincola lacisaponensis]KDE39113.1 Chemotaxis protein CheD [Nitrincola lacisaponensis]
MNASARTSPEILPEVYFDPYFEQDAVKVLPGGYYVTARDMILVTVLGSSVCACLRDAQSGVGGVCHFMLPERQPNQEWLDISMRYGRHAMTTLLEQLRKSGARPERVQAKVFGACNALESPGGQKMGLYNSRFVVQYLQQQGIPVLATDLMDVYPRKVYFFPRSGRVLVKKLKKLNNTTLLDREADYYRRLSDLELSDEMEMYP